MTIQRKLLTSKQQKEICDKQENCYDCPLGFLYRDRVWCCGTVRKLQQTISKYWNEEVEVDL